MKVFSFVPSFFVRIPLQAVVGKFETVLKSAEVTPRKSLKCVIITTYRRSPELDTCFRRAYRITYAFL